jgi:hypothetical protein
VALAIVLGTGPSLAESAETVRELQRRGALIYGVNNTYEDFKLDAWIACDPAWHDHFGKVEIPGCDQVHWNRQISEKMEYRYIPGRWFDGLSTDPAWISFNHCSSAQALNLAVHAGCEPIALVGHDFNYDGGPRHYFGGLSDRVGEYPRHLRKYSEFDGLIETYRHIAEQDGLPAIYNCTPGSRLPWFPRRDLAEFLDAENT